MEESKGDILTWSDDKLDELVTLFCNEPELHVRDAGRPANYLKRQEAYRKISGKLGIDG